MAEQTNLPNKNGNQNRKSSNYKKRKNYHNKQQTNNVETNAYGYNTSLPYLRVVLGDYMDDLPCSIHEIRRYARNPQFYNKELRDLAWWAYSINGSVRSAINYICTMHTLDKVVVCKSGKIGKERPRNFAKNRKKMISVLNTINYKKQIRDNLMKDANDGTAFYYFETVNRPLSNEKFLSDIDVENIVEINSHGGIAVINKIQ